MDFTIKKYVHLLRSLKAKINSFQTFNEALIQISKRSIILRHDVDLLPENSLRFAKIQAELGIKGSYYFRAVPESWDENIIKSIAGMGHEVGYHYENMDTVARKFQSRSIGTKIQISNPSDEHINLAWDDFRYNLDRLRKLVPVTTICMHGSPRSKFDNKAIWEKYDYKKLGIIGEPYFDVDFDEVFYLTDTGRRWDGWKTSVRDKVPHQEDWNRQGLVFHSTQDIIDTIEKKKEKETERRGEKVTWGQGDEEIRRQGDEEIRRQGDEETRRKGEEETIGNNQVLSQFPDKIMFTFHPQRWHDSMVPWTKELIMQNVKNVVKMMFIVR